MKVLFINTLYFPYIIGGAERSVQFLAEGLVNKGHQAVIVATSPRAGMQMDVVNGVKVYYLGLKNIYWPFKDKKPSPMLKSFWHLLDTYNPLMTRAVDKIINKEKPDVVHTNNLAGFSVAIWPLLKKKEMPIVHTIRDYYLICPAATMYKNGKNCSEPCPICRFFSYPRLQYSNIVDVVIGISDFILKKHTKFGYFHSANQHVIFNAYKPNKPLVLSTNTGQLRFGYIGHLDASKGIEYILQALKENNANFTLKVAGNGTSAYERYLKQYSAKNVCYLGFVEAEDFFNQIDVLIVPSLWHEPLGRIVFEAYAHGLPVIGSKRGGIPELIEEGQTGFLFDPDCPQSFIEAINKFIQDKQLSYKMRENCLKKAHEFIPELIIGQYLEVYKETESVYGR